jgi:hypothetical protein
MIQQSLESDEYFSEILNSLRDPTRSRSTTNRTQQFELREGLLYMKEGNRLCIPKTAMQLRLQLLKEHHETPIAGHLGIAKTYESLQRLFFWPKLVKTRKTNNQRVSDKTERLSKSRFNLGT